MVRNFYLGDVSEVHKTRFLQAWGKLFSNQVLLFEAPRPGYLQVIVSEVRNEHLKLKMEASFKAVQVMLAAVA